MAGRPSIRWRQVERYFLRRGYRIVGRGGDKYIIAPTQESDAGRTRNAVMIGSKCCSSPGDEVWPSYLSAIRRGFGVGAEDISND